MQVKWKSLALGFEIEIFSELKRKSVILELQNFRVNKI